MKTLNEVAENYFNTLNPIAERISADIVAIKDAYEGLWNCLSNKERNQIINETVVQPEAVLKYALSAKSCEGVNLNVPLITRQVTGSKYIVDESTGITWRDEHSAPFSWKTPSQIDLTVFNASKGEPETKPDNTLQIYNKSKENDKSSSEVDKSLSSTIDKENNCNRKYENKKGSNTPLSHNVVLVGTCSKLSGLCSKLKFLPGKSYTYEVQTVVSNPTNSSDGSFLDKIKASAVLKFQNTFKLVGGKTSTEKKAESKETENLVHSKNAATIVKLQKPNLKIAKPKSPPPPPPPAIKTSQNEDETDGSKGGRNSICPKNSKCEKSQDENDPEKTFLLGENSMQSFLSADRDSSEQDAQSKVVHDLSDDLNSMSTECTPLSGPIPKSGFDFLDNW